MKDCKRRIIGAVAASALAAALGGGCADIPEGADEGPETAGAGAPTEPAATPAPARPGDEGIEEVQSALRAPGCVRVVGHSYDFWSETNKYFIQNSCDRWWYVSVDLGGVWPNTGCGFVLAGQIGVITKRAPWKIRYNGVDLCGQ